MANETNMVKIKNISKVLLNIKIEHTQYWPTIAQHPFTQSGVYCYIDDNGKLCNGTLEDNSETYKIWKIRFTNQIENASKLNDIFFMLNKPWYLFFLKLTKNFISEKEFPKFLRIAFTSMEKPNMDPNVSVKQLTHYFKQCDPKLLMNEEEFKLYKGLPDTVTVYRGVTPYNEKNLKVLSWTTDPETAAWFAKRYGQQGKIYTASIQKRHIFAYFNCRNEKEVIVNPNRLQNIRLYKDFCKE